MITKVNHQPSGGKEWVAEITGRHPKYKFNREFQRPIEREWSGSGKTGITMFELEEGKVYEINEPWRGRKFVKVECGKITELDAEQVLNQINQREGVSV